MSLQLLTSLSPCPSLLHLKLRPKPLQFTTSHPLNLPLKCHFKPLSCIKLPSNSHTSPRDRAPQPFSHTLRSLSAIKPYVISEHKAVIFGWLCSFISVFSLSQIVPKVGKFSAFVSSADAIKLRNEGLVLGVFVLVRLVASYWQQAFLWDAALNAVYRIRVDVFQRVLERELRFFEGRSGVSAGDIAYRISAEAAAVADTIYALLGNIVPSTLQLSAMAMQMLSISPVLSLISAMVIPCIAFVIASLGEGFRSISKKAHLSVAALSTYLNEVFPAILVVKANNAEQCESARFQQLAHTDLSEHLRKKKMKALIPQILQIMYFGALFILYVGSLVVSSGSFDGCSMVSFVTSLIFLIEPIQGVGKAYNEWKQGEPAIERLFDLTRLNFKVVEKPNAVDLKYVTGEVNFCDVKFKYGDNCPLILNGLNLHIKAGETVAFVGPSGGGKTTLVKLLLRLYDPLSGYILIDNNDIQNLRLDSLRRHVGLVLRIQDLMTKIDMERVELAARTANADEFIRTLPKGYNTNIGPRGSVLSGGQKQRLAIARALYQDSCILILDEATSALDSRSELLVRQAVERLMENHTVLVISHRLETVLMARRVFLLDDGKLEELTHSTLLEWYNKPMESTRLAI